MTTVLEKARGAAAFSLPEYDVPDFVENSAAIFVHRPSELDWDARLTELKRFRSFEDDWDGEGAFAPGPDLTDGAISLAQSLQKQGFEPPHRVVVGVNGTIFFEWHLSEGYHEIEVHSPTYAEARWLRDGSDQVVVSTIGRAR